MNGNVVIRKVWFPFSPDPKTEESLKNNTRGGGRIRRLRRGSPYVALKVWSPFVWRPCDTGLTKWRNVSDVWVRSWWRSTLPLPHLSSAGPYGPHLTVPGDILRVLSRNEENITVSGETSHNYSPVLSVLQFLTLDCPETWGQRKFNCLFTWKIGFYSFFTLKLGETHRLRRESSSFPGRLTIVRGHSRIVSSSKARFPGHLCLWCTGGLVVVCDVVSSYTDLEEHIHQSSDELKRRTHD